MERYIGDENVVVVPKTINGVEVKRIGERAFERAYGVRSVYIEEGITSIGK